MGTDNVRELTSHCGESVGHRVLWHDESGRENGSQRCRLRLPLLIRLALPCYVPSHGGRVPTWGGMGHLGKPQMEGVPKATQGFPVNSYQLSSVQPLESTHPIFQIQRDGNLQIHILWWKTFQEYKFLKYKFEFNTVKAPDPDVLSPQLLPDQKGGNGTPPLPITPTSMQARRQEEPFSLSLSCPVFSPEFSCSRWRGTYPCGSRKNL